ncbi:MAG: iron-sulfur cluster assembly accessory protein [Gammaproteobacteria bacterium]|nr:iron-sulfur cluster assembly accessory protein [Gammaproteobacteria bacterium]
MSAQFKTELTPAEVNISPSAQEQLLEIIKGEASAEGIRIFVSGGGCSGMTYGMTYAEGASPFDSILQMDDLKIFVDSVALSYLSGVEIDYKTEGLNSSFVFKNVFAATGGSGSCGGCGSGGGGCA